MEDKPKILKNVKIIYNKNVYDKIYDFSCWDGKFHFSNKDDNNTTTNITCEINEVEINTK